MSKPNKTQENEADVTAFLEAIEYPQRREDCKKIALLMAKISGDPAKMWGTSIVGFGRYHYKYDSGREGDSMRIGFSPRARNIALYIITGFGNYQKLLVRLGKHKTGKSCLYIKKLADVDAGVLTELITRDLKTMDERYPKI